MKIEEWSGVPIEKSEWEKWAKQILDSTTIRHTLSGDTIAIASYPEGPHGQRPERVYICKVLYTVKPEPPAPGEGERG